MPTGRNDPFHAIEDAVLALSEMKKKLTQQGVNILSEETSEDLQITSFMYDQSRESVPLDDRTIIHKVKIERDSPYKLIGVDGSSRRLSTPYGGFSLATVSCTFGPTPLLDYPPLEYAYPLRINEIKPFIGMYRELVSGAPASDFITIKSPSGHEYRFSIEEDGVEFKISLADIAHEVRTNLETFGIKLAVNASPKLPGKNIVLLDGPLYQRPWRQEVFRSSILKADWRALTEERVRELDNAWKQGIPVVASVKRVDRSGFLVRIHDKLEPYVGAHYPCSDNDYAEVRALLNASRQRLDGYGAFLIGPFSVTMSALNVPENIRAPDIVYVYVAVPYLPSRSFSDTPCNVFRLEVTKEVYEEFGIEIFKYILSNNLIRNLPDAQISADIRCREISRSLFIIACETAMMRGVELTYDTWIAYLEGGGHEVE